MTTVLFLCIGNSCRSQMAEGFAHAYGSDVIRPLSAGLAPAPIVQPLTKKVMADKNINIDKQFPKDMGELETQQFDIIVNISGTRLAIGPGVEIRIWDVDDPMAMSEEIYTQARDKLEGLVMGLILELRRRERRVTPRTPVAKPATPIVKPARIGFGRMRSPRE